MVSTPDDPLSPARLRVMQIIAAALLVGVLMFLGVALYMVLIQKQGQGLAPPRDVPFTTLIAGLVLVSDVPLAVFIPRTIVENALKQMAAGTWRAPPGARPGDLSGDGVKLLLVRQTSLIITLALFEGAAFLGIMAFLLEAQVAALAVVAVAVFLMLMNFPTERRVRAWLDLHLQRLAEMQTQPRAG